MKNEQRTRRPHTRAEEAVIISEVRYRRLFEAARDGILILDANTGDIIDVNPFLIELLGMPRAQFLGKKVWEIGPFKDVFASKEKFLELQRVGYVRYDDLPLQSVDGHEVSVEFVSNVYSEGKNRVIQCNIRDNSKRNQALAQSHEKEHVLSESQKLGHVGSWFMALGGRLQWSDETYRIYGVSPDTFSPSGESLVSLLHPDDQKAMQSWIAACAAGESPSEQEFRVNRPDGTTRIILGRGELARDAENRPIHIAGTVQDITERKRAEADIREAYEMQGVLNTMLQRSLATDTLQVKMAAHLAGLLAIPWLAVEPKGGIFLLDGAGKTLALTVQQGLSPALLRSCANVPLGKCLCGMAAQLRQVVTSTAVDPGHEITHEGMLGHGHYCVPIMAGDRVLGVLNLYLKEGTALTGKQGSFIKAATDILAANIIQSHVEGQLGQSQKMEAVGRLAGGVAHDFNNLLTAINGYAGFLLEGLPKDDPKREDVKEILAAGDRAAGLTRQLLAFSRKQILTPQVLDINATVGATAKMLTRLIGEDIKLETRLAAQPCLVKVDAGQLDQVLLNLAVNARDAMPKGGTLTLETGLVAASAEFSSRHPDIPRGPLVCLSVSDTGCGMSDEVRAHLFEPFFTTKEKGKGTGMGLAMVFGIVKQSGGEIEVESEPDRGTTFRIYLPQVDIASKDQDQDMGRDKDDRVLLRGTETVLFVEDEDVIRRLGERGLTAHGYTVLVAANGAEALKVIERHGKAVDLLVTDVVMPGMSGRDLARELAKKDMVRRTLFISGYTDDAIVQHGVLEPGLAFLYKPFSPNALLLKLRAVLDGPADQARA